MAKVVIAGAGQIDGEYEFDHGYFTNRELHLIKKEAGVRAGEMQEAMAAGDTDLALALALIALGRNGKQIPSDVLWDMPVGGITLDFSDADEEDEALPPESPPDSA